MTRLALLALLPLFTGISLHADPTPHLITQLGSSDYRQREQARAALEKTGEEALEPLRAALQHPDAEVRRHVRALVAGIERRQEMARILKPTRVRLEYRDTPVAEAVKDLAGRGYPVRLLVDADKLADRRITLDMGEVPFWEAFDQFKEAAGLRERFTPEVSDPRKKRILDTRSVVQVVTEKGTGNPLWVAPVLLEDGRPRRWPTFRAGPLRLRALPPRAGMARGEVFLTLGIATEPAIGWEEVAALSVHDAVDDRGRRLDVVPTPLPAPDLSRDRFIRFPGDVESPTNRGIDRLPIILKGVPDDAVRLRELRGVLAAWVCSAIEPVIAVTDPLNSAGKTWAGPGGTSLRISKVRAEGGEYEFELELQPSRTPVSNSEAQVIAGGVGGKTYYSGREKNSPFTAVDAEGKPLVLATGHSFSGGGTRRLVSLHFLARKGQGPPVRLIFTGRWATCVNIPFVLRDVPLR